MFYNLELTDTFGGQANYSWCNRETIELPDTASDRQIIMAAKAALGLTGTRCKRSDYGECIELKPVGACAVAFIMPCY